VSRASILLGLGLLLTATGAHASDRELVDRKVGLPHVILLGLDTVRADHLGCYGNEWVQTPHFDRFAESAVLFEDCSSSSSWTLPAFASLFTGLLPHRHGAVGGKRNRLDPRAVTIAEVLAAHGYRTTSFVAVDFLTAAFGMARGFSDRESYVKGPISGRSEYYQDEVLRRIGQQQPRPWFLFTHYFDAHDPYFAPEPYGRMYYEGDPYLKPEDPARDIEIIYGAQNRIGAKPRSRYQWLNGIEDLEFPVKEYAAGVTYLDAQVGAVLDSLEAAGYYENSIIVVVADHGEHLTEHETYFTHRFPYVECAQVPLMIRLPGGAQGGRRVADPVSLVDVVPTLMELLGLPVEQDLDGQSLVPTMRGERLDDRVLYAEYGGRPRNRVKAVWNRSYRFLEFSIGDENWVELYDRRRDRAETENIASREPRHVVDFQALLTRRFGPERHILESLSEDPPPLDPEVEARLRALGYIE